MKIDKIPMYAFDTHARPDKAGSVKPPARDAGNTNRPAGSSEIIAHIIHTYGDSPTEWGNDWIAKGQKVREAQPLAKSHHTRAYHGISLEAFTRLKSETERRFSATRGRRRIAEVIRRVWAGKQAAKHEAKTKAKNP